MSRFADISTVKFLLSEGDSLAGRALARSSSRRPLGIAAADAYHVGQATRNYDVTRDGQRFLMIKEPSATRAGTTVPITVIVNWIEELKQGLPLGDGTIRT